MVICFNANTAAKKALDNLLATRQFTDTSEAISMALVTYDVLQQEVSRTGELRPQTPPPLDETQTQHAEVTRPLTGPAESRGDSQTGTPPKIPDLFTLKGSQPGSLSLLSPPELPHKAQTALPPAAWLFGQYNKLLPAKATCRALLNLLQNSPAGISPNEASSKISFAACGLGDYLLALDGRLRLRREEAYSAAFPSSAITDSDSRTRFGAQFVASMRQGHLVGLPASLRFVAAEDGKDSRISLTKAGADFALMPNPVLDEAAVPARKFSETETEFLLAHIKQCVPEETSAYASILDAVETGANTPDQVDVYLRKRFKLPTEKEITKTFLTTQRTGAISRMADLGLLAREKDGLRVTYVTTPPGKTFRHDIKQPKNPK